MSAKYCVHCGAPLHPDVRFCSQCGRSVQSPPAASQPPPQPAAYPAPPQPAPQPAAYPAAPEPAPQAVAYPAEPILDVIPVLQRRAGVLGMRAETFNLILTPARLVFVPVTSQEMREAVRTARDGAKAQGRGLLGQMAAQMAWVDVVCNRYRSMPIDAVLAQYPGSFCILNNQVSRVRFRETVADDDATHNLEMTVESAGGKHRFDASRVPGGNIQKRLKQALPHAVR
jgi:hypothetical protein